jgi:hypothetical protein
MHNKNGPFHKMQACCQKGVKHGGKKNDKNDQERAVPPLKSIRFVIEHQETLDLGPSLKGNRGDECLPAQDSQPT